VQRREIAGGLPRLSDRTKGVESLGSGPLGIALLQVACGHVVHGRDRHDRVDRIALGRARQPLPDDDADLSLELHLFGHARQADGLPVTQQAGRWLQEEEWLLRDFVAELLGVIEVVAAYADDLGESHWRGIRERRSGSRDQGSGNSEKDGSSLIPVP
jgi:hypothetical protein